MKLKPHGRALLAIAVIVAVPALAFAWASGWLAPGRLTASEFVKVQVAGNADPLPPGFRRAHGKGQCFSGTFRASGEAEELSTARLFSQAETPVIGRFSIGHGSPYASDAATRTTSLALQARTDDGQQWRMALNSIPFFATSRPEGFLEMLVTFRPDPATGKPDPQRVASFNAAWPEAAKMFQWSAQAPWADSYANAETNSVHAFALIAADGTSQYVRWTMRPHDPFSELTAEQRQVADENFLSNNLQQRLEQGPVYFDMVLTLAEEGDAVDDPSQPWPEERARVVAGTLEVSELSDQAQGACRDINFDPTRVPTGVRISADPVLAARAATYARSFDMRMREIGRGLATDAIGLEDAP